MFGGLLPDRPCDRRVRYVRSEATVAAVLAAMNAEPDRLRYAYDLHCETGCDHRNLRHTLRRLASLGILEHVSVGAGPATHYRLTPPGRVLSGLPRLRSLYIRGSGSALRLTRHVVVTLRYAREAVPKPFTTKGLHRDRAIPFSTSTFVVGRMYGSGLLDRSRSPDFPGFEYRLTQEGDLVAAECCAPGLDLGIFPGS